jgi:predicted glycogen debranching enzyme
MSPLHPDLLAAEWLEADGLGGFSSSTVAGWRTRRYHGLLTPAVTPPSGRAVLVAGFDATLELQGTAIPLSTQHYAPDVLHPLGYELLRDFTIEPWPTWIWTLPGGGSLTQELCVPRERSMVALRWRLGGATGPARLRVRPFLAGRDSHALHRQNPTFRMDADIDGESVRWQGYAGLPAVLSVANAEYRQDPVWYRQFLLTEERARGFDHLEDFPSPGEFTWDLAQGEAVWMLAAIGLTGAELGAGSAQTQATRLFQAEAARRSKFPTGLARAADAYLVRRGAGQTIIAGYPWFTDWGRDTFIALRGLCLAQDRLDDAGAILRQWANTVSEGMLPNRFVEAGDAPEFNSVDASLWYVIAVHEYLHAMDRAGGVPESTRAALDEAVTAILRGYARGTRYGIGMDQDGLLRAGVPGVQLTWMDAKVGDWVVTPRIGKPVEIQALWINALLIGAVQDQSWSPLARRALASFRERFPDPASGGLFDVIDVDHVPATADARIRPNQIFAVGGLPHPLLEGSQARRVVDLVEQRLWTPVGPRSLAPGEPGYAARYEGGPVERDASYHQGTVWPWLAGPFIEAWVRAHGDTPAARTEARARFLTPLLAHLGTAGLGHVSEIADAEAPYTPRGCPFQAWSVGELLRLEHRVLHAPAARAVRRRKSAGQSA